jgi:lysozyme
MNTKELLIKHEGIRFTPYKCSMGRWTIGIGRNLSDKGITKEEALYLLDNDIKECERDLANDIFKGFFYAFPQSIQSVLISMRFQLGRTGFRNFRKMIMAFRDWNFAEAIVQMRDSKWYEQVPTRANELIKMVKGEL